MFREEPLVAFDNVEMNSAWQMSGVLDSQMYE